ncbi:cysteine-rich motor neuron 1 protein-like [Gigantopelta aegis]|uniref:cysteine-rich motor neuron 1 protein-like n=1 Tax=Gigantopelta aegis TaxID=1735272 RepID=UPI001B889621|nr:cysteine-rich motor neuron 1 protein-like [Gigantopelta aegis]
MKCLVVLGVLLALVAVAAPMCWRRQCSPRPPGAECRYGYLTDRRGCMTCICKRGPKLPHCPSVMLSHPRICAIAKFRSQCSRTWRCFPGMTCCPGICGSSKCIRLKPRCPYLLCARPPGGSCPFGYETDGYGCPTCICKGIRPGYNCPAIQYIRAPDCTRVRVAWECTSLQRCPFGKSCCPGICGGTVCVKAQPICPLRPPCAAGGRCRWGYKKDRNGCPTCECRKLD